MGNLTLEEFKKAMVEQTDLSKFKEDITLGQCAFCHT